jgi:hypothetical protein
MTFKEFPTALEKFPEWLSSYCVNKRINIVGLVEE